MEPVRVPVVLGVKVTLSVQLVAGFTVAPQVFVWANGPDATMLPTLRIARPVFVSVTFWARLAVLLVWLGKVRLGGANVRDDTPVPLSGSICGLTGASSVMLTAAVLVPVEEGVKVTVMLQLPPAGMDVPQLLVSAKSPLFGPVTLIE